MSVKKYRARPVEIEAFQWKYKMKLPKWAKDFEQRPGGSDREGVWKPYLVLPSTHAGEGDYVVNHAGRVLKLSPDAFEKTYEEVSE